ncbi:MAG: long-chain fatty acid--CoA ligase [Myxococcota bacterium]|nr:long-chain fatty acid--CoA ligase [Myxococcota bacterium]
MTTIPHRLFAQGDALGSAPAYHEKIGGDWVVTDWQTYADTTRQVARALIGLGLQPNGRVCILSFNRPEWVLVDVGCMAAGGVPAGIYETCSAEEVAYILQHSEARLAFVESEEQWNKIAENRAELSDLKAVVTFRGVPEIDDPLVMSWADFLTHAGGVADGAVAERLDGLKPDAPATFIYTSGTTGPPKAVMLSHNNLAWTADAAIGIVGLGPTDSTVSYLPLSHIAEQMFTILAPITAGSQVYYAQSRETMAENIVEVQPTVFLGVPRVWEKMHAKITAGLENAPPMKKRLAGWALGVGQRVNALRNRSATPGLLLTLQYRLARRLVYDKARPKFGMGRVRVAVTGAAPIAPEIIAFFAGLDLQIHEVYGQSEDCGPTSFNRPGATKIGTVGPAIPGVTIKIAGDGEILVSGPNVFLGYYKDPAATAEALTDGWLYSGDLGQLDEDGFLSITGRKKDIIITAGGKNIAPKNIEAALKNLPLVSQAVVIGDRRKFISALITLDPDVAAQRSTAAAPHEDAAVRAELQRGVDSVNERFARVEHVRKFTILPRDLDVENKELTPTLKVKRRIVSDNWAEVIEAMYAD